MSEELVKPTRTKKPPTSAPPALPATADPVQVLNYILTNGGTTDAVGAAMRLANEWQDREAARVYGERFALFQAELPQIEKTRQVDKKDGSRMYSFAALEDIESVIQPIKAKYGLSTSGTIEQTAAGVRVVWVLQIGSHRERREYLLPTVAPAGQVQHGNVTQNLGAWMKYLWRYTYTMSLGVQVKDEDTDANIVKDMTLLTDEQRETVNDWIADGIIKPDGSIHRFTAESLLAWRQKHVPEGERSLDTLTRTDFEAIVATFKPKNVKAKKGGAS